mgnify:CR=1 FL=1
MICFCATDNPEFALYFGIKQNWNIDEIKIYQVKMQSYHCAPFAIVHATQRALEKGNDVSNLVDEYWNPSKSNWKFYEYFGLKMTIIEQIEQPSINQFVMKEQYYADFKKAQSLNFESS